MSQNFNRLAIVDFSDAFADLAAAEAADLEYYAQAYADDIAAEEEFRRGLDEFSPRHERDFMFSDADARP